MPSTSPRAILRHSRVGVPTAGNGARSSYRRRLNGPNSCDRDSTVTLFPTPAPGSCPAFSAVCPSTTASVRGSLQRSSFMPRHYVSHCTVSGASRTGFGVRFLFPHSHFLFVTLAPASKVSRQRTRRVWTYFKGLLTKARWLALTWMLSVSHDPSNAHDHAKAV